MILKSDPVITGGPTDRTTYCHRVCDLSVYSTLGTSVSRPLSASLDCRDPLRTLCDATFCIVGSGHPKTVRRTFRAECTCEGNLVEIRPQSPRPTLRNPLGKLPSQAKNAKMQCPHILANAYLPTS